MSEITQEQHSLLDEIRKVFISQPEFKNVKAIIVGDTHYNRAIDILLEKAIYNQEQIEVIMADIHSRVPYNTQKFPAPNLVLAIKTIENLKSLVEPHIEFEGDNRYNKQQQKMRYKYNRKGPRK
jgi:hypothetical protein